jgi:hypothetical protein
MSEGQVGIHVGAKVDDEFAENLGSLVADIFKAGKEHGMDQSTIVEALNVIGKTIKVEYVNVSGANVSMNDTHPDAPPTFGVHTGEDDDFSS